MGKNILICDDAAFMRMMIKDKSFYSLVLQGLQEICRKGRKHAL